jgi:hypothetical protein
MVSESHARAQQIPVTAEDSKSICTIGEVTAVYVNGRKTLNVCKTRLSEILLQPGWLEKQFERLTGQF